MRYHKMVVGDKYSYSVAGMKADFISTVTRRRDSLTFAMKKRPTSGHVTYIWTQDWSYDVSTHCLRDLTVFVVWRVCQYDCVSMNSLGCLRNNKLFKINEGSTHMKTEP